MSTAWPTVVQRTTCTNTGPHGSHDWRGKTCAGHGPVEALTLSQIEGVATVLGIDSGRLALSIHEALTEGRVQ